LIAHPAMDAVGATASIISIIELTATIASICLEYSRAVKNAQKNINRLSDELTNLQKIVESVEQLLDRPESAKLLASRKSSVDECLEQLKTLHQKLEPGKRRQFLGKIGLRELKWPFDSKEVEEIISRLERYKSTIFLAFQADQT
jgi:prefoldin subunit 5